VNGVTGSNVSIINTNALSSSTNTLTSTVNGVASSGVNIINSNATSLSGTNLTTTVNGVAATALDLTPAITSKAWSLTGNSGTSYTTNFLGTTDNKSLRIKTNNTARMIIDSLGNVGMGTASPTNALHVYAASNPIRIQGLQTSSSSSDKTLAATSTGVVNKAILGGSYFIGNLTSNFSISTINTIYKFTPSNVVLDIGNEYSSSTGVFTPSASGVYVYEIDLTANASSATNSDYAGNVNDRNVMGFVDNSTGKWIGRFNYEVTTDNRSYHCKGVVSLTAGNSYYFGMAISAVTSTVVAYPSTGCIGTRFSIQRIN
jgi:C1q domain